MSENWVNFHCDFVICVETTANVLPYSDSLKELIKTILRGYHDTMRERYEVQSIAKYRVKFIFFKDYACCPNAMLETEFFNIDSSEEQDLVDKFIDQIEFKGGYGYCNAFEAIALGIQSEWMISSEDKIIRDIWLFSNGKVRPLGGNQKLLPTYPPNMPESFEQLSSQWHAVDPHNRINVYMMGYVPKTEPCLTLQIWNYYQPPYTDCCGMDFKEIDHMTAMEMLIDMDYR